MQCPHPVHGADTIKGANSSATSTPPLRSSLTRLVDRCAVLKTGCAGLAG